ncbi:putative bifunctional diguanylate cyclase/phosphodiesterase [Ketobacter sp.]
MVSRTENDSSKLNTLIVEDNKDDFLLLVDYIEASGLEIEAKCVDTESDLVSALDQPWDIVFSDYSMPNMNGARALEIVRRLDQDVPFVFVSGTIGEEAVVNAIKSGAQDYVMKSDMSRLRHIMDRELREANNRREQRDAENTLKKLSQAIRQSADSVFITDASGHFEYVNPAFELLTGYELTDVKGDTPSCLKTEHSDPEQFKLLWDTLLRGETYKGMLINRRKDGSEFYEEKVISPVKNDLGDITHFVSTGRDVTARMVAEQSWRRMRSVLEATPDLVAIFRPSGEMVYLNASGFQLLGVSQQVATQDLVYSAILPEKLVRQLDTEIIPLVMQQDSWSGESQIERPSAQNQMVPVSLVVLKHNEQQGNQLYFSLVARDISERIRFESELQHQANHDSLTSLPNRYFLLDRLKSSIASARRRHTLVAVLFLDLDGFKRVNDNLGHLVGDEMLRQVADRLRHCLRPADTIARLGGDEFTVVVEDLINSVDIISIISKFYRVFQSPIAVGTQEFFVTFSTGVAIYPQDGSNETDLLRHADMAMYRAKSLGSNQYQFYAPEMDYRGREILRMDTELRYAIENDELCLYYQPQVDAKTRQLMGVEALIRWRSPARGLVSPAEFVPLLESSGMILQVGHWVIEKACEQYNRFREAGFPGIRVSANVSAVQFRDSGFLEQVTACVQAAQIPPDMLELEITENIVMQDPERVSNILFELNKLGVRMAIDDFGTGYSSLVYLKRFPLHTLKIDRSFICDVTESVSDATIVEASISLAHKLGLDVVAEGVETDAQCQFLSNIDCNYIQGFWFSKPMPEDEIISFLGKTF